MTNISILIKHGLFPKEREQPVMYEKVLSLSRVSKAHSHK